MIVKHHDNNDIERQVQGAHDHFFGIIKGLESAMPTSVPVHVYHYTTPKNFLAIMNSNSIRLHTVHNFKDNQERKHRFLIENEVKGTVTDNMTGATWDIGLVIRDELSNGHVFIQSNCIEATNHYLWDHYAQRGEGVCLRLSTRKFIDYLNGQLPDFDFLPDYFKCCHVMYDPRDVEQLLTRVSGVLSQSELNLGHAEWIVWHFYIEYFRNLIKSPDPYAAEKETRFMVSDNYSLFLNICSLTARWGQFSCTDKEALSARFEEEHQKHKLSVLSKLGFESDRAQVFVKVPLQVILEGVILGPSCPFTKDEISKLSHRTIRKSQITRSYLRL